MTHTALSALGIELTDSGKLTLTLAYLREAIKMFDDIGGGDLIADLSDEDAEFVVKHCGMSGRALIAASMSLEAALSRLPGIAESEEAA